MGVITGTVYGADGEPASGRIVRIYRRDTGALLTSTVTSHGGAPEVLDAHWDNVTLLLPMDGAHGSTTFTDIKGGTVTSTGSAKISYADGAFGGSSAHFDGTGGGVVFSPSAALGITTEDFTLECFVKGSVVQAANYPQVLSSAEPWTTGHWSLALAHASAGGKMTLWPYPKSSPVLTSTRDMRDGLWHHVAATRSGDTWRLFIDGVLDASATYSAGMGLSVGKVAIGGTNATEALTGYVDDVRITKGVARYLTNFAPPSAPVPTTEVSDPLPEGVFSVEVTYSGEVQRVVLDDDAGDLYNDLIDRIEVT